MSLFRPLKLPLLASFTQSGSATTRLRWAVTLVSSIAVCSACVPDDPASEPSCYADANTYAPGDSFPSADGCNTCSCLEDGQIGCTERACQPSLTLCGGIQGLQCADGEYCDFARATACGSGDQLGECRVLPQSCDSRYSPVCGCDQKTYGNDCEAATEGVSVLSVGTCESEVPASGKSCGGFVQAGDSPCDTDEFCQYQAGALCGAADAPGQCVLIPDTCIGLFDPVCGCDGNTYSNSCEAAVAEMGILEIGECK